MTSGKILNSKIFNIFFICAFFLLAGTFSKSAYAQEKASEGSEKKFEPKDVILEHISDAHFWPVALPLVKESKLPLPVILYTDKGLEVFSSAKLLTEDTTKENGIYHGKFYSYKLAGNKIIAVNALGQPDEAANKKIWDFSITRNVAGMFMTITVLLIIFLSISSSYRKRVGKAPKGLQSFLEPLILFIRDDVAIPNIGIKHTRYMPLLLTVFFFILINNLFGMIPVFPAGFNLTGNIAVTLTLATITLLVVNFSANKYYWKHIFLPPIPIWLYIIMVPVELISVISRPFALMIRLFANITAGHIIVLSLISLIFIFNTLWISPVSVVFTVFIDTIELLVAFLQAYIFTMLTSLFIGMAIEEHH